MARRGTGQHGTGSAAKIAMPGKFFKNTSHVKSNYAPSVHAICTGAAAASSLTKFTSFRYLAYYEFAILYNHSNVLQYNTS